MNEGKYIGKYTDGCRRERRGQGDEGKGEGRIKYEYVTQDKRKGTLRERKNKN